MEGMELLRALAGAGMLRNKVVLAGASDAVVADVAARLRDAGRQVVVARDRGALQAAGPNDVVVYAYLEDLGYDAERSNDADQIALLRRVADLDPCVVCCRSTPDQVRGAPEVDRVVLDIGGAHIRMDLFYRLNNAVVDCTDTEALTFALDAAFAG